VREARSRIAGASGSVPAYPLAHGMLSDEMAARLGGSPELAKLILERLPAGVGYFDAGGALCAWNPELERLLGTLPRQAGQARFRPRGGADGGKEVTPVERALAGEAVCDADLEVARPDGTGRWVKVSALPLPGGGPPAASAGAVMVVLDVGEARGLDALRDQILAVVAHDLRNPLSALRMTATMLNKPQEMTSTRRMELAERMLGTIGRMEALVATLVEHAQSERGMELRLQRGPTDLDEIYAKVKRDLDVLFPGCAIQVTRRGRLEGHWDAPRIQRVLSNLLTNAIKHGAFDVPVTLTLDGSSDDVVWFSVHNQGKPMAAELLPRLFEAFAIGTPLHDGRRRQLGLGLFIVDHLVTAHGGKVSAASSTEDGTTFIVTLPRR
jgi:PAS domain S-box-containing protein